ncbi:hypothetical protein B19861_17220 [Bifidobacterium adolescentis]|uniref:BIG2 domain-containing protein n=2 Tax=Bifidobacterium adolescentis TaxID=1680 RepID=A0ABN6ZR82_BIFAD|nr:hypothetical protein B19861_17220 [Bifidobacterium faecale]
MGSPHHKRIDLSRLHTFPTIMAVLCTMAMLATTFIAAPFARADQDSGLRIEIDDSKTVGNWNISKAGQVVDLAVGQKVRLKVWNYQGNGQEVVFKTVDWQLNGQPVELAKYDSASGQWKDVSPRDTDEYGAAIAFTDTSGSLTTLREGEATITAKVRMSGGPEEVATAHFRVHKTKLKIIRSLDSQEVTSSDTTPITAGEAMRLKYYPTFDGDGTTAQNKKYSYEFSTSMWNSPSSYRDESGRTIKADGWRSSNGAAADFNGQLNPTANEVTVRALIAGQVTISVNAIFAFSHAVNKANGFKQQTDLLGNLSAKTAISNVTPNVSVRYGSATSPVTVQDNGTVNLGVGEILQFNYSISPLHTDYATQLAAHWDSDKKTVATLDSDTSRKLTAIDTGLSNVTASIGGVTFKFSVNVSEPKLSLSYQGKLASPVDATSPRTVELTAGESMDLTMGYTPRHDYTSLNSVTWNSSDTNVATVNRTSSVSSAGNTPKTMVTAKLPGTVTITGTLAGRQVKTTIKVVDATLSIVRDSHQDTPSREDDVQVPVTGKNVDATSGESFKLYTKITPAHDYASFPSSVTRTTWTEDSLSKTISLQPNGDAVTVNAVSSRGQAKSQATVTAEAGGKTVTTKVSVARPKIKLTTTERDAQGKETTKDITGKDFQLNRNQSKNIKAVVGELHPDYAKMDMNKVAWASETPSAASVSRATGETIGVQGKGEGTTKINATLDGVTATVSVKVVIPIKSVQAPDAVTTYAGKAPNLPQTVHVTWDDGRQSDEVITWDKIQPDQYAKAGNFSVNGTVKGYSGTVRVSVRVLGLRSYDPVNIVTQALIAPTLPNAIKVTWTDGTQTTEKVVWDSIPLNQYQKPNVTFKVNGKLANSDIQVIATVTVNANSVTMYRLYDRYTGEHFYTSDVSERDHLVSVGWPYEGVGWRSGGSVPVYRQYNPYARTGTHNYTADGSENDRLVSVGSGTPVAPSSPVLGSYLRDELALDGADGNLQIDWFDPSRARVTYLWEGMPPWLLHQTSSRRVSGGWDISDRLATYQFRTDNNKAALQELDHYAKSARRLSHS